MFSFHVCIRRFQSESLGMKERYESKRYLLPLHMFVQGKLVRKVSWNAQPLADWATCIYWVVLFVCATFRTIGVITIASARFPFVLFVLNEREWISNPVTRHMAHMKCIMFDMFPYGEVRKDVRIIGWNSLPERRFCRGHDRYSLPVEVIDLRKVDVSQ